MRIAVVSDVHDNVAAFEAVVADLRQVGADLVVHGGDLVGTGSRLRGPDRRAVRGDPTRRDRVSCRAS